VTPLLLALACSGATPPVAPSPAVADAEPEPAGSRPDGAECLASAECASGVCEGLGCGDDQPGACMGPGRACTRDLRPYCGCDGETFFSSGTCPNQRYEHPGACDGELPQQRSQGATSPK
jgi:hypothetical protein